jgi:hypothetical protein
MFRRPSFSLAEVAWRWSFGGAALFLCTFGLLEYLNSLPVSNADLFLLRTGHPALALRALAHVTRGSALRLVLADAVLAAGLALFWILLASVGRASILASLLDDIRARAQRKAHDSEGRLRENVAARSVRGSIRSLAGLNFLRVALTLAALLSVTGAMMASGSLNSLKSPHPALSFLAFIALLAVIVFFWTSLNWFLSLASLFVARDGQDALGALSSAVGLCRERLGAISAVGTWFGLAHLTLFMLATSVVGFPLAFAAIVPPGFVLVSILLITLAYFALVDTLYIGRLAGYVAILEAPPVGEPAPPPVIAPTLPLPTAALAPPETTQVDQDELILSDCLAAPSVPHSSLGIQSAMVDQDEQILSDRDSAHPANNSPKDSTSFTS